MSRPGSEYRGLVSIALALAVTVPALPALARPTTGDVVETTREAVVYTRPGGERQRGALLTHARFRVQAVKSSPGCPGLWLRIDRGAWLCSRATRPTELPPGGPVEPTLEPGHSLPSTFVSTHDARVYRTLEDAVAGRRGQRLPGEGGYRYRGEQEVDGKRFVDTDIGWIPAAEARITASMDFEGVYLDAGAREQRLAFVGPDPAPIYDHAGVELPLEPIVAHYYLGEIGDPIELEGRVLYSIEGGRYLDRRDINLIEFAARPRSVGPDEPWLDVQLSQQTLVAYLGDRPVYATLVSTSRTATPPGEYRIQRKRAWARMRSKPDYRRKWDVTTPWAITMKGRLAMHLAYWHNQFGRIKSQGCVNLSARDAKWVWDFTGPALPPGWARLETQQGDPATLIRVRR